MMLKQQTSTIKSLKPGVRNEKLKSTLKCKRCSTFMALGALTLNLHCDL